MLEPVYDILNCGPRKRFWANGKLVHNSNFLNMKRQSPIRETLLAPKGFLLAPIDASQIELRVGHYLAGGPDEPVLQMLREGKDPYADLATKF